MGRTENVTKNFVTNILGQIIQLVVQFVGRTIFIATLSAEYLGVNGLFSNIFSLLSLAELGFGMALVYALYKPIANNDEHKIAKLMNLYKRIYQIIALVILCLGLALLPFLDVFIAGDTKIEHLTYIYCLYLIDSVSRYFFSYKQSLINANQKNYITVIYQKIFVLLQNVLQIIVLLVWKNFYIYLCLQILSNLLANIAISHKADKMYPYLKKYPKDMPDKTETKAIFKNTYAMSLHKFGMIVVNNTDNLLMSALVSLKTVGIYSNYILLINNVDVLVQMLFGSMTASVGNLCAVEDKAKIKEIYNEVNFLGFWIYSFCSISLICLINPFIKLWIGDNYLFDQKIVLIMVINFFINGMRKATITFRDALGLFWYDRYKAVAEALINIVVSYFCTVRLGLIGIFIGTITSVITTSFWLEPYILYKHEFNTSVIDYFVNYLKYTAAMTAVGVLTFKICQSYGSGWGYFILRVITVVIVYNLGIFVLFIKTKEMKNLIHKASGFIKKYCGKKL